MSPDAYRRVAAAAAAGDPDAQSALEALNRAADAVAAPKSTRDPGGDKGIAEARRRFGSVPGDAA